MSQYFYICCTVSPSKSDKIKEGKNQNSDENPQTLAEQEESSQDEKLARGKSLSSLELKSIRQTEKLIRAKSAPVVILDELEELL